jgi:hypothetical protein
VRLPGTHGERLERSVAHDGPRHVAERIRVEPAAYSESEVRDAEDPRQPFGDQIAVGLGFQGDQDAARKLPWLARTGAGQGGRDVAHEDVLEQRAVAALEADLVVVDDRVGAGRHGFSVVLGGNPIICV